MKSLQNTQHKPRLLSTLLSLFALMCLMATQASADVNVLIIGSTKDGGDSLGGTSDPFSPTAIATELQKILAGVPALGTANVVVEERYASGSDAKGSSYSYNLASWFHWPYPADVETTTRWPKLRGEPYPGNTTGTAWDYVILIGDPYTMENYPGLYAHGVAMIGQEVAKGSAETVLLMNWPAAGSTSTVAHYKEVVYRAGRTGGYKVAPAALAWEADGKSTNATRRAFICASSIYSTIWGQSAKASSYVYDDTLADAVHTNTTTNNNIAQPYTGFKMDFQNPWLMLGDKRREVWFSEKGSSTENYYTNTLNTILGVAGVMPNDSLRTGDGGYTSTPGWTGDHVPIAWNLGRDGGGAKSYVVNPDYWQLAFTFDFQLDSVDYPVADANDFCTARIFSDEVRQANTIKGIDPCIRNAAWRLMWGQIHKQYPDQRPVRDGSWHVNTCVEHAVGAFIYTLYSGRCPMNPNDDGNLGGYSRRVGYETAWRLGTGSSRAPGFKVMPSAATAVTVTPSTTETMTVQFLFPPKNDVTVTVSSSDTSAAIVGPQKLVFTPTNYNVPQSVKVAGVAGSTASAPFNVVYNTSSNDPAYDGLSDSWAYTCKCTPTSVTQVNRGTMQYSMLKNNVATINLIASGANASNTTFAGPGKGTLSWVGSDVIYTPSTDYIGSDGFAFASLNGGTLTSGYIDINVVDGFPDGSVYAQLTDASAAEQGSDPGAITITRVGATSSALSVNFTMSGSATHGSDYTLSASSPITIPAGQSSVVVTFTPVDDSVFGERIESATLTIAAGSGYNAIATPATISIADNDNRAPVVSAGTNQTVDLAAGVPWSPANLAVDAWWDASDDATATVVAGEYQSLADKSGNGHTVTAPTVARQPTRATWQGRNAIRIVNTGTSGDVLATAANVIQTGDNFTMVSVMESSSIGRGADGYGSGWSISLSQSACAAVLTSGGAAGYSATGTVGKLQVGKLTQGSRVEFASNGGAFTVASVPKTSLRTSSRFEELGTSNGGSTAGYIGEVLIFRNLISDSDRQKIEGYLAHKWETKADLPTNHPYKGAAPGPIAAVNLSGSATDADGDPLTTTWSLVSKDPSTAPDPTLASTSGLSTTASFSKTGSYVLRLSANDGYITKTSDVTITVVDTTPTYALTVTGGSGDGSYVSGAEVTITADAPAPGYRFVNWTSSGGGSFANASSATTTFTMPANAVTVTANYGVNTTPVVNAGPNQTVPLQGSTGPVQMILAATDPIQGFKAAVVGGNTTAGVPDTDWPAAESPPMAIDGNTSTKYLNYGKVGSGFYITPAAGATTLTGVRIYTANDASGRDPLTISIEGSNGGDLSQGSSWTLIQDNINLGIDAITTRKAAGPLVAITASASYKSYRIIVKSMRGSDNCVQYSELQLHGYTGSPTIVNLNGSATDADGDSLTTTWSVVGKDPSTAANPGFGDASKPVTSAVFKDAGIYTLRLSANDGYITKTSDVTITVGTVSPTYSVTYNANTATGGTVPVDGTSYNANATVTVLGNTGNLVKSGYTFNGWNTAANGSGTNYSAGNTFSISSNVTLYAKWTAATYSVTYNANTATGGTVPVDATSYNANATVTVLGNTGNLVKTGYTFSGWNTSANGSGTNYSAGNTFSISSNVTLYAKWTAPTYALTVTSGSGDGAYASGAQVSITADAPASGYRFVNWTSSGGGSFANANSSTTTFTMPASAVTVTANYALNKTPVVSAGSDQAIAIGVWTPASLTTALWLDASHAPSVILNGSTVSAWNDRSGNNRHATQTTATAQPTLTPTAVNGLNALTFDGNSDFLNVDLNFLAGVSHSAFIVTKTTGYSNIYGAANGGSGAGSLHVGFGSSTAYRMNYWGNDFGPAVSSNFKTSSSNILNYVWTSGASKQIFANGTSEGTNASAGSITAMAGGGRISNVTGLGFYGGTISEIIMITGSVTVENRQKIEGYLAHKWGTQANLPTTHPYKAAAPVAPGVTVNLNGSATDADGDSLTTTWSVVNKDPSTAANPTFGNAAQSVTTAAFTEAGTYTLRLSANDGYVTVNDEVTIKVGPPLPVKYATWSGGTFANPFTDTALTSNPDGDSMSNLMEFAFGTDPTLSSEGTLAIDGSKNGSPTLIKNGGNFDYYFVRRKDHGTSGSVSYTAQFSNNLTSFTNSADTPIWVTNCASDPTRYEVVKVPFPNGTKFGRVEIVEVP